MHLWGPSAYGRDAEASPAILAVKLYITNDTIMSDMKSSGLFSDRIAGTIRSGLPAVVELFYILDLPDKSSVKKGMVSYELRYEVWDDYYSIEANNKTTVYTTFDAMSRAVHHLEKIALIPLHEIKPDQEYAFRFGMTVNPLRGSDRKKIAGWVGETVGGTANESWREQVLNLNDLIQHFFSKRKDVNRSEWFQTEFFKSKDLLVHEDKGE